MKKMEIELKKDIREQLVEDLKRYFSKERDEEIGNLGAELLLDYILDNIGPYIYNIGIADSYKYMNERVEDLLGLEKRSR
ncbi:hypothetical protein DP73_09935 [Desulfosporosinus sp. HMP52]|uniref:DUF2164 domain-containing protein n=1 Tax=Desulfosporosinus sp. HMP52 TaxID=1487923 RepID=UPI00051F9822|nr:DUF2164 domain-containing protein [Desulfosporosinus sp. HMP52]KGK89644.1 hypothetical protein DP73_09935 [Desulfosporosinus sp. HMP52]